MIVSIIDFETTGKDPETCEITEVATVLYDWATDEILRMWTRFVLTEETIPDKIIDITGITPSTQKRFGVTPYVAFGELRDQLYDEKFPRRDIKPLTQFFVGHNAHAYDKKIFHRYLAKLYPMAQGNGDLSQIPWFDTMTDLQFPAAIKTRKLTHLNMEYGYLMKDAHRALHDCLGCVNLLRQFPVQEAMEWLTMPVYEVIAKVEKPWLDRNIPKESEIAYEWGFRFDREREVWAQKVKEVDYFPLIQQFPLELSTKQLSFLI